MNKPITTSVRPKDLKVGDKVERVNRDLDYVTVTISSIEKVRKGSHTVYRVTFAEQDDLEPYQRPLPENSHLRPGIYQPTQSLEVVQA